MLGVSILLKEILYFVISTPISHFDMKLSREKYSTKDKVFTDAEIRLHIICNLKSLFDYNRSCKRIEK